MGVWFQTWPDSYRDILDKEKSTSPRETKGIWVLEIRKYTQRHPPLSALLQTKAQGARRPEVSVRFLFPGTTHRKTKFEMHVCLIYSVALAFGSFL